MLHFGERIKFLRKKNGLSQEELASALRDNYHLGTDRAMISKWETNFQSPAAETLADIADFFGVTMDSFVSNSAADDAGRLMREYVAGENLPCGSVPGYSRAPEGMPVDFCVTVCDDTVASQGFLCGDKIYGVYGGVHISPYDNWSPANDDLVRSIGDYNVERLGVNHCTGYITVEKMIAAGLPVVKGTARNKTKKDLYLGNGDTIEF